MSKLPSDPLIRPRRVTRSLFAGGPDGKEHRDWEIGHDVHDENRKDKNDTNERKTPNSNRGW